MEYPPSATKAAPTMKLAIGEAKNTIASAVSSCDESRPNGTLASSFLM